MICAAPWQLHHYPLIVVVNHFQISDLDTEEKAQRLMRKEEDLVT